MKMKADKKTAIYALIAIFILIAIYFMFVHEASVSITRTTDVIFDETASSSSTLEFVPGEKMGDLSCTVSYHGKGEDTVFVFEWEADVQFPPPTSLWPDEYSGYIWVPQLNDMYAYNPHYSIVAPEGSTTFQTDGGHHVWAQLITVTKDDTCIKAYFDGELIELPPEAPFQYADMCWYDMITIMYNDDPDYYDYLLPYINKETLLGWGGWTDGTVEIYSELGYYDMDIYDWITAWETQPITLTKNGNVFSIE